VETKISLPEGTTFESLAADPIGVIKKGVQEGTIKRTDKLTVSLDQQFPMGDLNGNAGAKWKAEGPVGELYGQGKIAKGRTVEVSVELDDAPGAAVDFLRKTIGEKDLPGALNELGEKAKVSAKVADYTETGAVGEGELSLDRLGQLDGKVEVVKRDVEDQPWEYPAPGGDKKSVNDLVADLRKRLAGDEKPPPRKKQPLPPLLPCTAFSRQRIVG
jgi:hypothetical protein